MRKKIGFSLSLAAAATFQAFLAQPLQARPNLECVDPPEQKCATYWIRGFSSYKDCMDYYTAYCAAVEGGNGGCVYDPRTGETVCW